MREDEEKQKDKDWKRRDGDKVLRRPLVRPRPLFRPEDRPPEHHPPEVLLLDH